MGEYADRLQQIANMPLYDSSWLTTVQQSFESARDQYRRIGSDPGMTGDTGTALEEQTTGFSKTAGDNAGKLETAAQVIQSMNSWILVARAAFDALPGNTVDQGVKDAIDAGGYVAPGIGLIAKGGVWVVEQFMEGEREDQAKRDLDQIRTASTKNAATLTSNTPAASAQDNSAPTPAPDPDAYPPRSSSSSSTTPWSTGSGGTIDSGTKGSTKTPTAGLAAFGGGGFSTITDPTIDEPTPVTALTGEAPVDASADGSLAAGLAGGALGVAGVVGGAHLASRLMGNAGLAGGAAGAGAAGAGGAGAGGVGMMPGGAMGMGAGGMAGAAAGGILRPAGAGSAGSQKVDFDGEGGAKGGAGGRGANSNVMAPGGGAGGAGGGDGKGKRSRGARGFEHKPMLEDDGEPRARPASAGPGGRRKG